MKIQGTIQHNDLEGGFWQLVADDGQRYTIGCKLNPSDAAHAGKRVEVDGEVLGGASIFMSGQQLRVDSLRVLEGDDV